MNWIEGLGYVATIVTLISMLVRDMVYLRVINSIGCLLWIGYGMMSESIPVLIVNTVILAIHIFKLIELKETEDGN
jgi:uncharacterized protein with PQ loop repeat